MNRPENKEVLTMVPDPFSGPCSRCGRQIDNSKEASTLGGFEPGTGRLTERICDECAERERRQKAGGCKACASEIENPDGQEGAICADCYDLYRTTDWTAVDAAAREAEQAQDMGPMNRVTAELPSAKMRHLAAVRMSAILYGNPLIVRQVGRRT